MFKRILLPLSLLAVLPVFTSYIAADTRSKVLIHTDLGDIKIVLYDETPKHRDNFLKLVQNHTLDSTLFHRVIQNFMIQGGDVDSKHAKPGVALGNGELGYTIPAEFNPSLFHKRGALAAARQGDNVNPNKESSSCQFYIVQGRIFNDSMLNIVQANMDQQVKQQIFNKYINDPANAGLKSRFIAAQQRFQTNANADSMNFLTTIINPVINADFAKSPHRVITDDQRTVYKTIGGAPHLDGAYTVFGEVISGLETVDKIAAQQVDQNARPLVDIHVTMKVVK
ncbi:MAG TPA: peptidylprolyl isomerase [Bacteroidia bacterium]|nr:peptidylprolyl isomerase [Bacteroidia bacterium]